MKGRRSPFSLSQRKGSYHEPTERPLTCTAPPSLRPFAHLALPLQLCRRRRHPNPFTSHPAVLHSSFPLQPHLLPPLHTGPLFGAHFNCRSSGGVLLSIKQWLVALATPPPPRLHYILSNKPERTNVSSPKYCPYLLKPPYPTPAPPGINISHVWFLADLHLTLKHILSMYEHFPIWVPLPPPRVFTR